MDPGNVIERVPRVLRAEVLAVSAGLADPQIAHFVGAERGHGETGAGGVLLHEDLGELFVSDHVREAGGKAQLAHVEALAERHGVVLQARVRDAELAQETGGERRSQTDAGIAGRVGGHGRSRESQVGEPLQVAVVLRSPETAEQAVLAGEGVVDPREPDVGVVDVFAGLEIVVDLAVLFADAVGIRPVFGDIGRNRVDPVRRDDVVGKLVADEGPGSSGVGASGEVIVNRYRVAVAVARVAEIAVFPLGQRHRVEKRLRAALADTFIIDEEEGPVADDPPAGGGTELVELERQARDPGAVVGPGIRIELVAAEELVDHAVILIGAGSRCDIDYAASRRVRIRRRSLRFPP